MIYCARTQQWSKICKVSYAQEGEKLMERQRAKTLPINALLDWPMGTPSGHTMFLDPDINAMLKKVLNA